MSKNILGIASVPTQPLRTTPVTILYKLSNPFTSPAPIDKGGTARAMGAKGDLLYGVNTGGIDPGSLDVLNMGAPGNILMSDGAKPYWSSDILTINSQMDALATTKASIDSTSATLINTSVEYQTILTTVLGTLNTRSSELTSVANSAYAQDNSILQCSTDANNIIATLLPTTGISEDLNDVDNSITALNVKASSVQTALTNTQSSVSSISSNMAHLTSALTSFGSYKNKIINGGFRVWQRGTAYSGTVTSAATLYYAPDHWAIQAQINTAIFVQQTTATLPSTVCSGLSVSFSGSGFNGIANYIESATTLQNRNCVLSFWARGPVVTLGVFVNQVTGSNTNVFSGNATLSNSWQQFSFTFAMPSTSVTPGTGRVEVVIGAASSWSMEIAQVQLEDGTLPSEFEYRPYSEELKMCQRFYETGSVHMMGYALAPSVAYMTTTFKTEKRASPSITSSVSLQSGFSGNPLTGKVSTSQLTIGLTKASTGDGMYVINWVADAELR